MSARYRIIKSDADVLLASQDPAAADALVEKLREERKSLAVAQKENEVQLAQIEAASRQSVEAADKYADAADRQERANAKSEQLLQAITDGQRKLDEERAALEQDRKYLDMRPQVIKRAVGDVVTNMTNTIKEVVDEYLHEIERAAGVAKEQDQ
jgi:ABC-type transporter Mla subunit MlaD